MLLQLFRSLLPFENPIGFGASDFVELFIAAVLLGLVLFGPAMERAFRALGQRTAWCMLLLALLPVVLRLALLTNHPAPSPINYREFTQLLVADTLRHLRLANPAQPLPQFFETLGVIQTPSYSSVDPPGQGMVLVFGRAVFGHPWAGVLLSTAAFCSLCYWMLRAWTTPGWALAGGLLAVFEFGPLNQWTNSYAGGAASAAAACLVFGSLPRINANGRVRDAVLLGLGIGGFLLALPFQSGLLIASAAVYLLRTERSRVLRAALVALLLILPALLLVGFHNKAVTGSWTMSPAALNRYQYGAHRDLTPQQQTFSQMQISLRGAKPEGFASYLSRLEYRIRLYRFFLPAPMYIAVLAFVFAIRSFPDVWLMLTLAIFVLGANFEPDVDLASWAGFAPLLILVSVRGLQQLSRFRIGGPVGRLAARLILFLCAAQFLFWYGLHLFETHAAAAEMMRYETWDSINHKGLERRAPIYQELARLPGRQLVFVHYAPAHNYQDEWVYNDADIGSARAIWARDLGPPENQKLQSYYPGRSVWLLDPDETPLKLVPYEPQNDVPPKPKKQISPFEEVH